MTDKGSGARQRPDWRSQLTTFLLGASSGMAANLVSGTAGYRAVAASVTMAALLMAATRLRALPGRAPIVRYATRLMLILSLAAVVVAAVGPSDLTPYMIFSAVALTVAAVLIPADPSIRFRMLAGAAVVGFGVAVAGGGVALLADRQVLAGATVVGLGVAVAGGGVALLADRQVLAGAAVVGIGVAFVGLGVALLADRQVLAGATVVGLGVAVAGGGVALLADRQVLAGAAAVGGGVAAVGLGVALLADRQVLAGATVVGLGVAVAGGGVALLADRQVLAGATVVGLGVAVAGGGVAAVGLGVAFLADRQVLAGAAVVGFGVALIGLGSDTLVTDAGASRVKRWLASLTREPNNPVGKTADGPRGENPGRRSSDDMLPEHQQTTRHQQPDQPVQPNR